MKKELTLHLVRGLPGSGKSTYAKKYVKENKAVHYEADKWAYNGKGVYEYDSLKAWWYHACCLSETFKTLIDKHNCVVSNTFSTYNEMVPYFDIAHRAAAKVSIHICRGNYGSIHNVPDYVVDFMKDRWEE